MKEKKKKFVSIIEDVDKGVLLEEEKAEEKPNDEEEKEEKE
jgi:hypothetical protein